MEASARASAASVFNILRLFLPSVDSYGDLTNNLLFFLFHMFERFHYRYYGIMVLWISIWIYKSLGHRLWKRLPERAQRASLTSSVHSYLRSIFTATSPTIYYSFYFTCSRDFIVGIIGIMILSVLWYYRYYDIIGIMILSVLWISIWIYKSLEHRLWKRPPERAQRASLTSSVYSYLRSIFTATSPTIFSSFYFTCSRDFIIGIMILWYYDIMN